MTFHFLLRNDFQSACLLSKACAFVELQKRLEEFKGKAVKWLFESRQYSELSKATLEPSHPNWPANFPAIEKNNKFTASTISY